MSLFTKSKECSIHQKPGAKPSRESLGHASTTGAVAADRPATANPPRPPADITLLSCDPEGWCGFVSVVDGRISKSLNPDLGS